MSHVQPHSPGELQTDTPAPARGTSPMLWILVLLAMLAAGYWWYGQDRNTPSPTTRVEAPSAPVQASPAPSSAATAKRPVPASTAHAKAARRAAPAGERAAAPIASSQVMPHYPPAALRAGLGGTVLVNATVGTDGVPTEVSLDARSGNRELDRAALQAVRQWRFQPALQAGKPIASVVKVPVEFTPEG